MSNALEIDTLFGDLPEELEPKDWAYGTNEDITSFQFCPYCTGLFWNPMMHLSASPECVRQLREAKEKEMEGKSDD